MITENSPIKNWLPALQQYPMEFKFLLDQYVIIVFEESDTHESVYEYLTAGDRHEKFTVYDFYMEKEETGTRYFHFLFGDFGFLSGQGGHDVWAIGYSSYVNDNEPTGFPIVEGRQRLSFFMS